jgi:hypothetical protein
MMRHPVRIITLNWNLHQRLQDRAALACRSLSNLVS